MIHDPQKRRSNRRKHRIDLMDGYAAFDAPMITREDMRERYGEQRFVSLGCVNEQIVVLVWTEGDEDEPRLISCRRATRHEEEAYFLQYPKV